MDKKMAPNERAREVYSQLTDSMAAEVDIGIIERAIVAAVEEIAISDIHEIERERSTMAALTADLRAAVDTRDRRIAELEAALGKLQSKMLLVTDIGFAGLQDLRHIVSCALSPAPAQPATAEKDNNGTCANCGTAMTPMTVSNANTSCVVMSCPKGCGILAHGTRSLFEHVEAARAAPPSPAQPATETKCESWVAHALHECSHSAAPPSPAAPSFTITPEQSAQRLAETSPAAPPSKAHNGDPHCETCKQAEAEAKATGKLGYVMCPSCYSRNTVEAVISSNHQKEPK